MHVARQTVVITRLERILAILAAVVCVIITLIFWFSLRAQQSMWLLPGLYFLEMVALSTISAFLFVRGDPHSIWITWGAAGVISAFSILGAFSVGFFYLPVALMFGVISIIWDIRNKQNALAHVGSFLVAGIVQSLLMLIVIFQR